MTGSGELAFGSVVHVNEKGGRFGGTEEYLALVTTELAARGVRSHLVCGFVAGDLAPEFESVEVVAGLASRQVLPDTASELAAVVGRLDPDVIYLHNLFDPAVVRQLAELPGRGALIWYVHDHYLTCLSELRWRRDHGACRERLGPGCLTAIGDGHCVLRYPDRDLDVAELTDRIALSAALADVDAVVVVSKYMRSRLAEAEPQVAERIHFVPRPIRPFGPRQTRHRRTASDPAVVTFAGRITPEKGLANLIQALQWVRADGPIELRIAGPVEHAGYRKECQELLDEAVVANPRLQATWLGHLGYPATDQLLRDSDIVTVPSQWPEPLGAVALEAMSAGAAVVASRIGGLDTWLVDSRNGLLVDPDDGTGWTEAIESLLQRPERAEQLGEQAHDDVKGLTAPVHVAALDEIVRGAVRPSEPPSSRRRPRR